MPPALFALVIFEIGSYICIWASLDYNPLIYASCVVGATGALYHAQFLLVEMGPFDLFARAGLEL
jgi:hypothetical protein